MSVHFSFEAIGTKWEIDIYQVLSADDEAKTLKAIMDRIDAFDLLYSRFRSDSWVTKLSLEAGKYDLPSDAVPMLSLYQDLYEITGGLMTPLIGQTLVDAGYDKDYSFDQKKTLVPPPSWKEVIEYDPNSAAPSITLKRAALIDVGAIGKGYLIDIVGGVIEGLGFFSYCVDAGGDILHKDARVDEAHALRIGLEHPEDLQKVIGVLTLANKSIAGSSGNRRKWGKFDHIINPATLESPKNILATWAIADTCILADAMSTALYFTPAATLFSRYKFDYVIMYADHSIERSQGSDTMLELF